ncbi:MAG: 50S ribosomal protein L1 [candidate division Zixibacteria bacterium]|nr:50S ribosomal protein L1 [candidate division Zixibacteria bacterium]MDH3939272.1 50S ribosomal protein L1 [candidate division Zixibacteria bacterium]MDH4035363.1 50S ribosomal protein L1 [candidate division Zixibacteria bacterium]
MKRSKNNKAAREKIDRNKRYTLPEAVQLMKDAKFVKFDESIEVAIRLGVNPKHADQMVRGTVALPHGTGSSVRVVVFAEGDKAAEATAAGADLVGSDDLAEKIQGGWTEFDVAVATPDMMRVVGKLGKVLGPRGLMPNPKTGTVTPDVTKAVGELKAGRIEYRVDKQANIASAVGKLSFDTEKIEENIMAFCDAVMKAKPAAAKGAYFLGATVCSSMGPGIKLDHQVLLAAIKK